MARGRGKVARLFCRGQIADWYHFGDRLIKRERENGHVGYGHHKRPPMIIVTKHLTAAEKRDLKQKCEEGKL